MSVCPYCPITYKKKPQHKNAGAEVKNFVKNILDNYISATSITCCISRT